MSSLDKILVPNINLFQEGLRVFEATKWTKEEIFFQEVAKELAKAMKSPGFREFVKAEAQKQFDGDYDILFDTIKNRQIVGLGTVMNLFSTSKELDFKSHPLLNISIPMHIEKWDTKGYELLTAAWSTEEKPYAKAYDSNGKIYLLDQNKEPNVPVLVVGYNERVGRLKAGKELGTIRSGSRQVNEVPIGQSLTHANANTIFYEWTDITGESAYEVWRSTGGAFSLHATTGANQNYFVDGGLSSGTKYYYKVRGIVGGIPTGFSQLGATFASPRNEGEALKLKRMKFSTSALRAVEKWLSGAPEIRLRVVKGSPSGATTVFTSGRMEPTSRGDIKNTWWNHQEVILNNWDTSTYGTVFTLSWREEDWDDDATFEINGAYEQKFGTGDDAGTIKAGGKVTISGDDGGDIIGDTQLLWWNNKNIIYNVSGFEYDFVQ